MTVKQSYVRKPTIKVTFITNNDQFSLTYNTQEEKTKQGDVLNKADMSAAIIGFSVKNDMNDDSGTFSLNIAGADRFDRILSPNDIITIQVNPGKPNNVKNDYIMVGMVSEVKRLGEYDSSSVVYQVTGNSMLKALMQLKLGTIQEVASLLGTNGWMMGMGGLQSADSYLNGGDSSERKTTQDLIDSADSKKDKVFVSSFYGPHYYSGIKDGEKVVATNTDYAIGSYVYIEGYGVAKVGYHLGTSKETIQLVGDNKKFGQVPTIFVNLPKTEVKKFGSQFKTVYTYKKQPKAEDSSDSTSTTTPGSQGITLQGESAAGVAEQVLNWFLKLHTKYHYENGKHAITDFITWDLNSWEDEYLMDPTPIMSYEGSLRQLISDNQAKPFNEFYADYTTDGKMNITMRKTPFEPGDWNNLYGEGVQLFSNDVVEEATGKNNAEAYSIFLANMPSSVLVQNLSALLSFPVYFPDMADVYGYSMLQVQNPYIFMFKQSSTAGGSSDSTSASGGGRPITTADIKDIASATMAWTNKGSDNVDAGNIDAFIKASRPGCRLNGTGKYFIEAGNTTGLNPIILLAFAALESDWGDSAIGNSNNFFGIGAFDNNPNNGLNYGNNSVRAGIVEGAKFIQHDYFNQGQTTLHSLFNNNGVHQYSTTPDEDMRIATTAAAYYSRFPMGTKKSNNDDSTSSSDDSSGKNKGKNTDSNSKTNSNGDNASRLKKYSVMLANWYGDNPSYISGEIRVLGNPDYRIGKVLIRKDNGEAIKGTDEPVQVDYYIESTIHEFNLTSGYTTTLGVTRGLPHNVDRFSHWNSWLDPLNQEQPGKGKLQFFGGGLFGEMSLKNSVEKASESSKGSGSSSGDSNNTTGVGKGDDYPAKWRNIAPDSVSDDFGYYNRECVSFVAYRLSKEGKTGFNGLGNAINWKPASGLSGQSKPMIGDVAWFNAADAPGAYGHVAYVSGVNGDTIYLEEYNYGSGQYAHNYHTRTVNKSQVTAFLRFPNK